MRDQLRIGTRRATFGNGLGDPYLHPELRVDGVPDGAVRLVQAPDVGAAQAIRDV